MNLYSKQHLFRSKQYILFLFRSEQESVQNLNNILFRYHPARRTLKSKIPIIMSSIGIIVFIIGKFNLISDIIDQSILWLWHPTLFNSHWICRTNHHSISNTENEHEEEKDIAGSVCGPDAVNDGSLDDAVCDQLPVSLHECRTDDQRGTWCKGTATIASVRWDG